MKILRIIALALLIAVSATSLAAASPHSYVPRHGKPCRKGYKKTFRQVHLRHHKRTTLIRICVKKRQPGSAIVPPQKQKRTILSARLNHSFIRNPEDPYEVSFDYGASAKQEETLEGQTLSVASTEMPTGVLAFYSDGILKCTENVGGTLEAANFCNVEYGELGQHKVTTIYTAGAESSAVSETVAIDPLGTTTAISEAYTRQEPFATKEANDWWLIGTLDIGWSSQPGVIQAQPGCADPDGKPITPSGCYQITQGYEHASVFGKGGAFQGNFVSGDCEVELTSVIVTDATEPPTGTPSDLPTAAEIESGTFFLRASTPTLDGYTGSEGTTPLQFDPRAVVPESFCE